METKTIQQATADTSEKKILSHFSLLQLWQLGNPDPCIVLIR